MNGIIEITGAFTNSFAINLTTAENGLSKSNPTTVVLGQDSGAVGDPGKIFSVREIPFDPGTFLLFRSGTLFAVSSFGIVEINNATSVSGMFNALNLGQVDSGNIAAIMEINAPSAPNNGAKIQITAEGSASAHFLTTGTDASLPVGLRNVAGIFCNNIANTNIAFTTKARVFGGSFGFWGDDGAGSTQEYFRMIPPVSANLDFPLTAAQTSSDLTVNVPGARAGDGVLVGVPVAAINANSEFTWFVSANDTVTIRFNNYSAAGIDPAAGIFKVGVIRILP